MTYLDHALKLAARGFYVFRLGVGKKTPREKGWQSEATRNPKIIRALWNDPLLDIVQPYNIGISTSLFGDDGESLIAVDIDDKKGKKGSESIIRFELEGNSFPPTFEQVTASGTRHLLYRTKRHVRNSDSKLADGVDTRGVGGLLVGAGSTIGDGEYSANWQSVAEAPEWLVNTLTSSSSPTTRSTPEVPLNLPDTVQLDQGYAEKRAADYLLKDAPPAVEGAGGNQTTFQVAAWVKDLGVDALTAIDLLLTHYNERCTPPWASDELEKIVDNVYRYGKRGVGAASPEADFPPDIAPVSGSANGPGNVSPLADPIEDLNRDYAFILVGSGHHILHETVDEEGRAALRHMQELTFHRTHAAKRMIDGNGELEPITKLWMTSPRRRSYKGLCFRPGLSTPEGYYNLFRGFAVEPLAKGEDTTAQAKESVEMFLDHARKNIAGDDDFLFRWMMGYFAQMFQKPHQKPATAIVLRGGKGVGKNAFVDRFAHLLGGHSLTTSNRRYLVSNFNAHLQNLLLFTFDEAFWSGDKAAEGILKDLITGTHHVIEHKGQETFTVRNCTRVAILGNEDWLVPASQDERRYAVFDVGPGRKQDIKFFESMRIGMEAGGYRLLLRWLLDFDLSEIVLNEAPKTAALLDQKWKTFPPFQQWWATCLMNGEIVDSELGEGVWPEHISTSSFRDALFANLRSRGVSRYLPDDKAVGKCVSDFVAAHRFRRRDGESLKWCYKLPPLAECRKMFEQKIGHTVNWD